MTRSESTPLARLRTGFGGLSVAVQASWGERGPLSSGFHLDHLAPNGYRLEASFRFTDSPAAWVTASSISFRVRPRAPREDAVYAEFARWGAIGVRDWTHENLDSALAWVSRRLAVDSADRFCLQLLTSSAGRLPVDSAWLVKYYDLVLAIAEAQATQPSGAAAASWVAGSGFKHFGHPAVDVQERSRASLRTSRTGEWVGSHHAPNRGLQVRFLPGLFS